jgi:hypothetical protein
MTDPIMKQRAIVAAWTEDQVSEWSVLHRSTLKAMLDLKSIPPEANEAILADIMTLLQALRQKGFFRDPE